VESPARGSQDGDQRAELRRGRLHGRFRGLQFATWQTISKGISACDAINGTIGFTSPEGKRYEQLPVATLLVSHGAGTWWALPVDGKPISGSLFDFSLFFFHNARAS
jgi:malate synthase